VPANNVALLILNKEGAVRSMVRFVEVDGGKYLLPLGWLLSGKLSGARLLDHKLAMSNIDGVSVKGIPGPRTLGAPIFAYALLLFFGWLSLSTPLLVRLRLTYIQSATIKDARQMVEEILSRSISDSTHLNNIRNKVRNARSIAELAGIVAKVRE
jgi:hypothetical protein